MQLVGSPITRPGPPSAIHPPPSCLCWVTPLPPEISCSSALLSPCTQSGEAWKAAGARQMENKEREQRHCSEEAKRQGASSLCRLASLAHQCPALATPRLPQAAPPRWRLASDLSLGDPWPAASPSPPFLICKMRELGSMGHELSKPHPFPRQRFLWCRPNPSLTPIPQPQKSTWMPTSARRGDPSMPWVEGGKQEAVYSQDLSAGCVSIYVE